MKFNMGRFYFLTTFKNRRIMFQIIQKGKANLPTKGFVRLPEVLSIYT